MPLVLLLSGTVSLKRTVEAISPFFVDFFSNSDSTSLDLHELCFPRVNS